MTIFVVPVLVYEGLGPVEAVKKSVAIIKKAWGESLIRAFGLGLIQLVVFILVLLASALIVYVLSSAFDVAGMLIGISIGAGLLLLTGLVFVVANTIFNTALYVYANNGQVASGFNEEIVRNAFKPGQKNQ